MCRHGPSRAPGETLVSTERIPGQAHFWIACWAVWVSGCCGIVQAAFSKLRLQIGGASFLPRLVAEETEALRGQCRVLCSAFSWLHYFFVNAFASI